LTPMDLNRRRGHSAAQVSGGAPRSTRRGSSCVFGRQLRDDKGQGVIEFALVLPILAALVFALFALGKVVYYYIDYVHLANEGARFAAVNRLPGGGTSMSGYLCPALGTDSALDRATITVSYPDGMLTGSRVQVGITSTYHLIPWIGDFPLRAGATMRMEQPTTGLTGGTCP
jgi:hypothetical protein